MLLLRVTSVLAVLLTPQHLHSSLKVLLNPKAFFIHAAASGLRPLCTIPPLLPPVGVWTVSQFQCGWSSSQTSMSPGEPLTPLQANPILGTLSDGKRPEGPLLVLRRYAVLATVSSSYPPPSGSFPDITHPSATRHPRSKLPLCYPFDLHVLGLPPAFNLSHDQTLQFKSLMLNELNFV